MGEEVKLENGVTSWRFISSSKKAGGQDGELLHCSIA